MLIFGSVSGQTTAASTDGQPPRIEVTTFLATSEPSTPHHDSALVDDELLRMFSDHGFKYFYRLQVQSLRFDVSKVGLIQLPDQKSASFRWMGNRGLHYVFHFHLPEYDVKTKLYVPNNGVFYQAGIRHASGTLILRFRTTLQ